MSLNNIDWRAEALEFAKKHDTRTQMVVQLVELAMKRGAEVLLDKYGESIAKAAKDHHRRNEEHRKVTRTPNHLD